MKQKTTFGIVVALALVGIAASSAFARNAGQRSDHETIGQGTSGSSSGGTSGSSSGKSGSSSGKSGSGGGW